MAFPLQLYRKLSSCTIRMTVNTRSMFWVMYVIQDHRISWHTGYATNYRKKKICEMLAWHKAFGFSQEISPVICVKLSKNRDRLWQIYTAPDGKQSFPPSHWLQAWHSIETFTQIHTRIREHFHPIGTALANQYARKPQGLVSHCFQTRPNSSYRKMYCATGGQAAIYSGNKPKRKTRSPCLSKSIREAPKSHKAARFWRAILLR